MMSEEKKGVGQPLEQEEEPFVKTEDGRSSRPDNNRRSALVALLCFFPFGILSLINSLSVTRLYNQGKYTRATEASKRAARYAAMAYTSAVFMWGLVLFLIACVALYLFFFYVIDWKLRQ